jgi:EAL domain-containing protein (putative c-di-GMP-specific phosphodiesterase class I)
MQRSSIDDDAASKAWRAEVPDIYKQNIVDVRNKSIFHIEVFNVEETDGEQTGLTVPVGYTSNYFTVIKMINGLMETVSGFPLEERQLVAINVSSSLLVDTELLDVLLHKLEDLPHGLSIEVVQLGQLPAPRKLNAVLSVLRDRNCSMEFDDFGGSNSQNPLILSEYAFDSMKLNAAFVQNMLTSDRRLRLLKLIVDMIKTQGKRVIATGVSTQVESAKLTDIGIYLQQGDYIHASELVG